MRRKISFSSSPSSSTGEPSPPAEEDSTGGRMLSIHVLAERPTGNMQFGAACFDCETRTLSILGRTLAWEGEYGFLANLICDLTSPDVILVSSKADEKLLDAIKALKRKVSGEEKDENAQREREQDEDDEEHAEGSVKPVLVPGKFFDFHDACKLLERVTNKELLDQTLGSSVDLSHRASVQAAGAVLLQASRFSNDMSDVTIETFDLGSFLIMDAGSTKALDISRLEEHPSVIRGRGRPKEGFTLMTLLDRAKSATGKQIVRHWISRPLTDVREIRARHDAVEYLRRRVGHDSMARLASRLARVGDLPRSLLRLKQCKAKPNDWYTIMESLTNMQLVLIELASMTSEDLLRAGTPELLLACAGLDKTPGLIRVARVLDVIDWSSIRKRGGCGGGGDSGPSATAAKSNGGGSGLNWGGRIIPLDNVDTAVDQARARLAALPKLLEDETMAIKIPGRSMRAIPAMGFVLAIHDGTQGALLLTDEVDADDMEFLFEANMVVTTTAMESSNATQPPPLPPTRVLYYKTNRARYLDQTWGDVYGQVTDAEDEVMRGIENVVLGNEHDLFLVSRRCAELDVLIGFAEIAHDFNYTRPEVTDEPITYAKQARHPLLERVLENNFVPSDLRIERSCLVVTGPNYSGKSCVLKTAALISVMSQIGSFVPAAAGSILGVVDRIFTRISSSETLSSALFQKESSFSIDVQQIVFMLRSCTPHSLLIVDEFGKGTDSLDGASLLASVIQHLADGKCGPTPRCMFATHLVEMFDAQLLRDVGGPGSRIVIGEMAVEFQDREPVPLFRLVIGERRVKESFAVACARRSGVNQTVLSRAEEFVLRLKKNQSLWGDTTLISSSTHMLRRVQSERKEKKRIAVEWFMRHAAKPDREWTAAQVQQLFELIETAGI